MRRWLLPVLVLVETLVFLVFGAMNAGVGSRFGAYGLGFVQDLASQCAPSVLLGLGMTLVIMGGGIDLSAASTAALAACVMGCFRGDASFWWLALPAGLATAVACGAANGFMVSRLNVPPILATLGTMILYRGLCFALLGDREVSPFLEAPGYATIGSPAGSAVLMALAFGGSAMWLTRSRWLHDLWAVGGNPVAARYAGVQVERRLAQSYVVMGVMSFLAAVAYTSRNGSMSGGSLSGAELGVIVGVVIGGTPIQGGSGTFSGTWFGLVLIAVLEEGLRSVSVWADQRLPFKLSHARYVLLGLLLLIGVAAARRTGGIPRDPPPSAPRR